MHYCYFWWREGNFFQQNEELFQLMSKPEGYLHVFRQEVIVLKPPNRLKGGTKLSKISWLCENNRLLWGILGPTGRTSISPFSGIINKLTLLCSNDKQKSYPEIQSTSLRSMFIMSIYLLAQRTAQTCLLFILYFSLKLWQLFSVLEKVLLFMRSGSHHFSTQKQWYTFSWWQSPTSCFHHFVCNCYPCLISFESLIIEWVLQAWKIFIKGR